MLTKKQAKARTHNELINFKQVKKKYRQQAVFNGFYCKIKILTVFQHSSMAISTKIQAKVKKAGLLTQKINRYKEFLLILVK